MKIRTQGDSMFPTLVDGALYEIEPLYEQTVYIGDIIVYCVDSYLKHFGDCALPQTIIVILSIN